MGLVKAGVDARLAVNAPNYENFLANYPELKASNIPVFSYGDRAGLGRLMAACQIAVATTNRSVFDVNEARAELQKTGTKLASKLAYYVQDYEPLFYPPKGEAWSKAHQSYTILKDAVLFAKTEWLCNTVYANHGVRVSKVTPSIDHDAYYPGLRFDSRPVIAAMLRPSTARRAPLRTIRIMKAISRLYGDVSLQVFGASDAQLAAASIDLPPSIKNWGVLKRTEVPEVLRSSDLFLDLSDYQAFGRTALEGMACGCIPVVPIFGGAGEYAVHGRNAFVVDTRCDAEIMKAVDMFIAMRRNTRAELRLAALESAAEFTVTKAALSELRLFRKLVSGELEV